MKLSIIRNKIKKKNVERRRHDIILRNYSNFLLYFKLQGYSRNEIKVESPYKFVDISNEK